LARHRLCRLDHGQGGNKVCRVLECTKDWSKAPASKFITRVGQAETVGSLLRALALEPKIGDDIKALDHALKKAGGDKHNKQVVKAVRQLKKNTVALHIALQHVVPFGSKIWPLPDWVSPRGVETSPLR
jgi:hypothetical protein